MTKLKLLSLAVISSTMLSGCVIAIHDDEMESKPLWKVQQSENREYINQLKLGSSINEITDELGGAEDSEGFERDGVQFIVLFYRTQHHRSDGKTTRDETTPLVFKNGKLVGWGHQVADKYLHQEEL